VGCKARGGSSPLGRTEKPWISGLFCFVGLGAVAPKSRVVNETEPEPRAAQLRELRFAVRFPVALSLTLSATRVALESPLMLLALAPIGLTAPASAPGICST
jgi:hypothetical protein